MEPEAATRGRTRTIHASGSTGTRRTVVSVAAGGLPDDPRIPALDAVARGGVAALLTRLGISEPAGDEVALLKYHAGRRCTFYAPTAHGGVAVKAYANDASPVVDVLNRLAEHGLASGIAPTVAPLVSWDRALRVVVTAWFDAPSAIDLVASGAGGRAGDVAAAWVRRTAALHEEGAGGFGTDAALRRARSRSRIIGRLDARLGAAAEAVAVALAQRPPAGQPLSLSHGSLYAAHVFDLGSGPGVIDCDRFLLAPPELDAGMFEATLTRLALDRRLADGARAAIGAFRSGIEDDVDARALSWHRAAALLSLVRRIAGRQEGDWRRDGAALLEEAARAAA